MFITHLEGRYGLFFDEFLLNVCILQSFKKLNFFMFSSVINFTNSLTLKFFCTQAWYYCLSYITSFIRKSHTNAKIWMGMGMNWTFCFIVRIIQTNNERNCCLIMLWGNGYWIQVTLFKLKSNSRPLNNLINNLIRFHYFFF